MGGYLSAARQSNPTAAKEKSKPLPPDPKKLEAARLAEDVKKKAEILERQERIMREEINQTWRIAVGKELPKQVKETITITNVTRRNVWMEDLYLFNNIKAKYPGEIFHSVDKYILRWQPPGSHFQIMIPLDDPGLQENAILVMSKLNKKEQGKVVFLCTTLDPGLQVFAEKVHPASLVSYRTKVEVLKKLSELFLEGKITVQEVEQVFSCDLDVWRVTLYNLLPEDEQVYHTYLMEKLKAVGEKPLHRKYLDEDITLKEYEELKFPDRTKRKYIESLTYPLPVEGKICVICGKDQVGVVRCHTCENMVCKQCILDIFHGKVRQESYLLMHHKYCMKLGELPEIKLNPIPDDAFLREFRANTRTAIVNRFKPKLHIEDEDDTLLHDLDEEAKAKLREEEARLRELEEIEERKKALENPLELQQLRTLFIDRRKKFEKYRRELIDYNLKIADASHTEAYINRHRRLRYDLIAKLQKVVLAPITTIQSSLSTMSLPGDFLPILLRDVSDALDEIECLIAESSEEAETRPSTSNT